MPVSDSPRQPSRRWFNFFGRYCGTYLRRHFNAVRLARENRPIDPADGTPAIVYLNHPSWWDPLACILLAGWVFPDRQHYGPMEAAMLRRYRIFQRLGLFGIEPGPRGSAQFLRAGEAVLNRPGAMLWMTAQGRFADARQRPAALAPGLAHLLRRSGHPSVRVYPLAMELTFWQERTPELLLRFGPPLQIEPAATGTLQELLQLLESQLLGTQDALAADAMARNAAAFDTMLRGRAGIGGIYDWWRRASATISGARFEERHGQL
jgi:1-acyl-sn-glycerol-3-phosphate acyltransferase